jgi:tripartite-type tricarboxylate transporter receptor subunit TctC
LLAQEIDVALTNLGSVAPHVADGRLRILAVMEPERYSGTPDVPAIREILPGFNTPPSWFGFYGPPGMSPQIVDKINSEVRKALASPDVAAKIDTMKSKVLSTGAAETRSMVVEQDRSFAEIIKTMNIRQID